MENGLAGRCAIVTGAAQGIGLATAAALAEAGARVLLADVQADKVRAAARDLASKATPCLGAGADVTRAGEVEAMVRTALEAFGRIDILVNNAGGSGTVGVAAIEETSEELWDRIVGANLKGTFLACQAVVPHMKTRRYGRIVNFSSPSAWGTFGPLGTTGARLPYAAAKGGIESLTFQLAKDLGPFGITVNVVVPGFTLTEPGARVRGQFDQLDEADQKAMIAGIPAGRAGSPRDIAWAIRFLAADESSYVSGATLEVTGGR
jgi:NAD(P)-dependent dehydrogenase (short-subunit alcohol dehydrogenase family)